MDALGFRRECIRKQPRTTMATESRHYREEIQELLDNRLNAEVRAAVQAHLEACEHCRRDLEALRWTRRQRPILAYGLMLLIAVVLVLNYFIHAPRLPDDAASDFGKYQSERLSLQFRTADVKAMEKYFVAQGVPFRTRVFDLGRMNYRLIGGRVHQLINRRSALFVYRGDSHSVVVCQMYPGNVSELPPASELRQDHGFTFHIYRNPGRTAVFWQEREITCGLVSDIDSEEVLQLAAATAMI